MGTTTIHPDWAQSKIVAHAIERSGTDTEPLTILETLHGLMLQCEEHAPGVPFNEILSAWDPTSAARGREAARALVSAKGIDLGMLDEIAVVSRSDASERAEYDSIARLARAGATYREIRAALGCSSNLIHQVITREGIQMSKLIQPHQTWTEAEQDAVLSALTEDHSLSIHQLEEVTGVTKRLAAAIQRHLVAEGLVQAFTGRRRGRGRPPAVTFEQVSALRQQGLTHDQIAAQLGCSRKTASKILQRGY